ncbi:hypothetical protein V6N11_034249 [Hibiscus sabdariffa]|uniref:Uncharacterized protein n=1 Tax=Hibiscus sabdariffa TaxID=183260 RepID=A0ABR1ZGQ3_9ROSI
MHWIKVNTDSARNTTFVLASCGGVGRDAEGNWRLLSLFNLCFWRINRGLCRSGETKIPILCVVGAGFPPRSIFPTTRPLGLLGKIFCLCLMLCFSA